MNANFKLPLLLVVSAGAVGAGHLTKIWEFSSGSGLTTYGLSFSPDGKRIAAVVGTSFNDEFVFILDAASPQTSLKTFDVNPKSFENEVAASGHQFMLWSPSSERNVVFRTLLNVEDGDKCSLPEAPPSPGALFVSGNRLTETRGRPIRVVAMDMNCRDDETWLAADGIAHMSIEDASPDRGLLVTIEGPFGGPTTFTLRDAITGVIVRQLRGARSMRFADSGKTLCSVRGADWHEVITCIETDTGRELQSSKSWGYPVTRPAVHASRILVSDYGRKVDFIDWVWRVGSLKRRVVWDYVTGKEVVSWKPKTQRIVSGLPNGVPQTQALRFAISPDGNYIAEGGAGVITLYRIDTN